MTQMQILSAFEELPTPQQFDLLQAALSVVKRKFSPMAADESPDALPLLEAARLLLDDYESDNVVFAEVVT